MEYTVIAISGSSGGNRGPSGLYEGLEKHSAAHGVDFHAIDTIADEIEMNVEKVISAVKSRPFVQSKVLLMGYSMGGAIAALAAERLSEENSESLGGVILLSTQTDGLYPLMERNISSLFFHGTSDPYFQDREIRYLSSMCKGDKRIVWLQDLDHGWKGPGQVYISASYVSELARTVLEEIACFFKTPLSRADSQEERVRQIPSAPFDRAINVVARLFKGLAMFLLALLPWPQVHRKIACTTQFLQDLCLG